MVNDPLRIERAKSRGLRGRASVVLPYRQYWEGWMRRREFIAGLGGCLAARHACAAVQSDAADTIRRNCFPVDCIAKDRENGPPSDALLLGGHVR